MRIIFLSKEEVKNPLTKEITEAGKILKEKGFVKEKFGSISVKYGKRMIITANNANLGDLSNEDFVEIVDYNGVTNVTLAIGLKNPSMEIPMHWFIYRKPEINAIIHIQKTFDNVPTTSYAPPGSIELAIEALKALRQANLINLKNYGSIAVGVNLKKALEELKCL